MALLRRADSPPPVRDYRDFGPIRLMSFGESRWLLPDGEFTYGEFHLVDITSTGVDDTAGTDQASAHGDLVRFRQLHCRDSRYRSQASLLWAAVLIGLVLVECGVLAANRGRCPLTGLAARDTTDVHGLTSRN